jgi:HPr kinase/phosphorylase
VLIGTCPELTRHHVEIRGLGLVNVTDLFGVAATRSSKRLELVVQLERWEVGREYDRLGLDTTTMAIQGVQIPMITMPIAPGRNVAMLVEVAARNQLLRSRGRHAARLLAERLERRLERLSDRSAAAGGDVDEDDL